MDYQRAKDIRGKSLSSLITDRIAAGGGIGESISAALSERSKARAIGLKEKFDPLNIIKTLTGGSRLAPALLGRLTGRSPEAIKYFSRDPKKKLKDDTISSQELSGATQKLGSIYAMMVKMEEEKKVMEQDEARKRAAEDEAEEDRNKELIKALTARVQPKKRVKKDPEIKKQEETQKKTQEKQEQTTRKKENQVKKEAQTKKETVQKQEKKKAETVKKVEEAKKAEPVKKVEPTPAAKPTALPKVPAKEAAKATIPTAAKVAGAAAIVGGLLMPTETVAKDIDRASKEVGVDKSLMYAMAKQESGFNPNAAAKTSSAKGLYQFIKGTWAGMVKKYGTKYPILNEKGPEDSYANALAGALYIKENSDYLSKFKIPINGTTIYAAHFLGPGGAKTLLTADPNTDAVQLMPKAAASNDFIFYNKTNGRLDKTKPRTVKEVIDVLFQKVGQYQEKYAVALSQVNTGGQINAASTKNRELKKDMADTPPAPTIVNNNTTSQTKTKTSTVGGGYDDRSAYSKKASQ
jgi:soluble lytic murein transglycosylase-like protein